MSTSASRPHLTFWQIWNMSFGFFGIQFGWGLQMGNMSAIYEFLGAKEDELPLLWLAAPITGLIVQPIIGHMSDRTWGRLGRRRPYFLVGAILASLALIAMPHSSALWMAAGLLWVLDASVNVSMEPFRAFVADLMPEEQRTVGFAMQSVFIGAGAVIASLLPSWLKQWGVSITTGAGHPIPDTVMWAFTIGAVVFLFAVLWTVVTTKEHPPEDMEAHHRAKGEGFHEILKALAEMPSRMKQLAIVQFFTWMALFCMWIYFTVAVPKSVLGATDPNSDLYKEGLDIAQQCYAVYNFTAFIAAMAFLWLGRKLRARTIHTISLLLGGFGLASVGVISNPNWLYASFVGVGIAWASILSMPYAMLSGCLPPGKIGVYMGIFNFFIVIPQILVAIILKNILVSVPAFSSLSAVVFGGVCMLIAAAATFLVQDRNAAKAA